MTKVQAIRVGENLFELISPIDKGFGEFFDIDSLNLILGRNGSGKTELLRGIAHAVASPKSPGARVYFNEDVQYYSGAAKGERQVCAIYYSGLPFRRRFFKRRGLIDASPRDKVSEQASRIAKLGSVTKALGIDTRLTAAFGYSRLLYRNVLVPYLVAVNNIVDPELNKLAGRYISLQKGTAGEISEIDAALEECIGEIQRTIEVKLFEVFGGYVGFLYLTVLEYMCDKSKGGERNRLARSLLVHIGLLSSRTGNESFSMLEEMVSNTQRLLSNFANPEDFDSRAKVQYFDIDGVRGLSAFETYETPIRIQWSNLASGLRALVDQFALIDDAIKKAVNESYGSVLLLIDEGDAYLHLDWQRRYVSLINKYLGGLKRRYKLDSLQLVLATHSPLLAADIPGEFVTNLDSPSKMKTFAAPLEEVIAESFDSSSLGEFAAEKINGVYRRMQNSIFTEEDSNIINAIGDVAIRAALLKGKDV